MRIALVYDCVFPATVGGAERWLRALAEDLARDHEVTYITRRQWEEGEQPIPGATCLAVAPGGPLYAEDGRRRVWPAVRFGAGVFAHLVRRRGSYDVVHCLSYPFFGLLAARLALAGRRTPRLFCEWLECLTPGYWRSYAGPLAGPAALALQTLCVRLTPEAFCFSDLVARRLRESGLRGPLHRLTGLLDDWEGQAPDPADRPPLVLFVGRHVPDKRVLVVADAVIRAQAEMPDLQAVLVGDGPERPQLLGALRPGVEAPGFVEQRELDRLLHRAACLVCASRRDGYGMVVAEAAAAGTPAAVMAAPDSAATELIEDGVNGRVVRDPADLAGAILSLVRGGEGLRRRTADWFEQNRDRLSMTTSIERVRATYEARRERRPADQR